jgi:hypothetical protein
MVIYIVLSLALRYVRCVPSLSRMQLGGQEEAWGAAAVAGGTVGHNSSMRNRGAQQQEACVPKKNKARGGVGAHSSTWIGAAVCACVRTHGSYPNVRALAWPYTNTGEKLDLNKCQKKSYPK